MGKQNEIKQKTKLLNEDGTLHEPGWCRRNLYEYNREAITAPKLRIKEWDFYQFSNERYLVQMVFANISIGSGACVTVIDMTTGKAKVSLKIAVGTVNRFRLPANGDQPYNFRFKEKKKNYHFEIDVTETERRLIFKGKTLGGQKMNIDVKMAMMPGLESITIATPWQKPKPNRFFYTQKLNSMPVSGSMQIGEEKTDFSPEDTFGVLDWGRGVWPFKNLWYWGNGTTRLPDGKLFGFEITWGFGDESNATETCLFYDGKAHKIGAVDVVQNPKGRWKEPWVFKSDDGRFDLTMTPTYVNRAGLMTPFVGAVCYQVHGLWNGTATLDDGTVLEIKDMFAFCEQMRNRW